MTGHQGWTGHGSEPFDLTSRLAAGRFKALFREGMALVEDVAAYLDGPGRLEAKRLPRPLAAAYATESMRLTTRLMQAASWLLVQKAIYEGDIDRAQGLAEKNRVQVSSTGIATSSAMFAQLPDGLQEFTARSLRLQTRILQYDGQQKEADIPVPRPGGLAIEAQFARLRHAYRSIA